VTYLRVVHSRWLRYAKVLSRWVHPCIFVSLECFFTRWKPLQQYKVYARSSSSLQLVSSCGVGNSTAGSFLTGWWAAQVVILSWIVPVHPTASPARSCKMGKCPFHWNWPENPITTLVLMDGILLQVCNRKKRCRAWSLVAATSHIRTLSMLLFQDSTGTSVTLFVQTPILWPSNVGMSSTPNQVHLARLLSSYVLVASQKGFRYPSLPPSQVSEWCIRSYMEAHPSVEVPPLMRDTSPRH
jgi:hypothetical protein